MSGTLQLENRTQSDGSAYSAKALFADIRPRQKSA